MTLEYIISKHSKHISGNCYLFNEFPGEYPSLYFISDDVEDGRYRMGDSPQYCYKKPWAYRGSLDLLQDLILHKNCVEAQSQKYSYEASIMYWNRNLARWKDLGWMLCPSERPSEE